MLPDESFEGINIYMAYVKKINKCLMKNFFGASEIVFFAWTIENNIFS
jgi:hypothetical protein